MSISISPCFGPIRDVIGVSELHNPLSTAQPARLLGCLETAAGDGSGCCWLQSSGKSHADFIIGNTLDTQWFEWWTNAFIESTATIYRDFWFRLVIIYSTSAALQKHCTQLQGCRLQPELSTATDWRGGDTSGTRGTWHVRVTSRQGRICTWTWLWAGARVWQHRPCPVSAGGGCCC